MASNFDDVVDFHHKFGVPIGSRPHLLNDKDYEFRYGFLQEEMAEIDKAHKAKDLAGVADGLVDLVYVAMGKAAWMGLPWHLLWTEVQYANMSKILAESVNQSRLLTGRGHEFDVVKPSGFLPPRIEQILNAYQDWLAMTSLDGRTIGQSYPPERLIRANFPLIPPRPNGTKATR